MSKMTCLKWGLVLAGATVAALNLGACLADFLLQTFVFTVV